MAKTYASFDKTLTLRLLNQALSLMRLCWSFDFVNSYYDEQQNETAIVHAPASWAPFVENDELTGLLFDLYVAENDVNAMARATILDVLGLIVLIRKDIFSSNERAVKFVEFVIQRTTIVMQQKIGLSDHDIFHQLCRLLLRTRCNFTHAELTCLPIYPLYIKEVSALTFKVFEHWQWSQNSAYYLLSLWSKMVNAAGAKESYMRQRSRGLQIGGHLVTRPIVFPSSASPSGSPSPSPSPSSSASPMSASSPSTMDSVTPGSDPSLQNSSLSQTSPGWEQYVPDIAIQYINTRLHIAKAVVDGATNFDDPLDNEEVLLQQLTSIAVLIRFRYDRMSQHLISIIKPLVASFKSLTQQTLADHSDETVRLLELAKTQLAWMVHIVGEVLDVRPGAHFNEDIDNADGQLSSLVFDLLKFCAMQMENTDGSKRLTVALLQFMEKFTDRAFVTMSSSFAKVFVALNELCGLKDKSEVIALIFLCTLNTLRFWDYDDAKNILKKALMLLRTLLSGYSTPRLLVKNEMTRQLLTRHTKEYFPFLNTSSSLHREFYGTIGKLLFSDAHFTLFNEFFVPFATSLRYIHDMSDESLRSESFRDPLIALFLQLRGILESCDSTKYYGTVFEKIIGFLPVVTKIMVVWKGDSKVLNVVLKFWEEMTNSRQSRLCFDQNSPNPIVIFRATCNLVTTLGESLIAPIDAPAGSADVVESRYKPIGHLLTALEHTISGRYVPFTFCAFYKDLSLNAAMETAMKMLQFIPKREWMLYPKLTAQLLEFCDVVFRDQPTIAMQIQLPQFLDFLQKVDEALNSFDKTACRYACSILNNLFAYILYNEPKETPAVQMFRILETQCPNILPTFMTELFKTAVQDPEPKSAAVYPLFSLISLRKNLFKQFSEQIVSTVPIGQQNAFRERIQVKLFLRINFTNEPREVDYFANNFELFKKDWNAIFPSES